MAIANVQPIEQRHGIVSHLLDAVDLLGDSGARTAARIVQDQLHGRR